MNAFKLALGVFALLFFTAYPIFSYGPKLAADMQVAQWEPAPELRVVTPKCTHWQHMVSTCELNYVDLTRMDQVQPTLDYFVPGSWAGERSNMLRAKGNPALVTTDIAVRDLGSRRNLMLAWIGLFGLVAIGFGRLALRNIGPVTLFEPQAATNSASPAPGIPAARMNFGTRGGAQFPTRAG